MISLSEEWRRQWTFKSSLLGSQDRCFPLLEDSKMFVWWNFAEIKQFNFSVSFKTLRIVCFETHKIWAFSAAQLCCSCNKETNRKEGEADRARSLKSNRWERNSFVPVRIFHRLMRRTIQDSFFAAGRGKFNLKIGFSLIIFLHSDTFYHWKSSWTNLPAARETLIWAMNTCAVEINVAWQIS